MRIALIGATGFIGSAIRQEALSRGHHVTAIVSNPARLPAAQGLEVQGADALDSQQLRAVLRGHDVVISAFSGHANSDVYGYYLKGMHSIIDAARATGVRLLVVGGAGSLEVEPGVQLLDTPSFPEQWKATAEGARAALKLLRETPDVDWTVLSPPPMIHPGDLPPIPVPVVLRKSAGLKEITPGFEAAPLRRRQLIVDVALRTLLGESGRSCCAV